MTSNTETKDNNTNKHAKIETSSQSKPRARITRSQLFEQGLNTCGIFSNQKTATVADSNPLSRLIWEECLKLGLPQRASQSNWMVGIKNGTLSPDDYNQHMVADVGYCCRVADIWYEAAKKAEEKQDTDLYHFCWHQYRSMKDFADSLISSWCAKFDGAVSKSLQSYIDYQRRVATILDAYYFLPAIYAASYLRAWLCSQIQTEMEDATKLNVYKTWYDNNKSFNSSNAVAAKIDELYLDGKLDKELVLEVLTTCLKGEINFLLDACGQDLIAVRDECYVLWFNSASNKYDPYLSFETTNKKLALETYQMISVNKTQDETKTDEQKMNILAKIYVENKKFNDKHLESINEEYAYVLIGKAIIESYLKITDTVNSQYFYYVLWYENNSARMLATDLPVLARRKYEAVGKTKKYAKVLIHCSDELKITHAYGAHYWRLYCIGYWWRGQERDQKNRPRKSLKNVVKDLKEQHKI